MPPLIQQVTLVANTVTTVNVGRQITSLVVEMEAAGAETYITIDGTTPTVGGVGTYVLSAVLGDTVEIQLPQPFPGEGPAVNTVVKLISAGTPVVSVSGA